MNKDKSRAIWQPVLFICLTWIMFGSQSFAFDAGANKNADADNNIDANKINFLALSDIHFDPFTSCGRIKPCPLIVQLRNHAASQWPQILAKYDGYPPQFREDTNFSLLTSTFAAAKQAANTNHAQFVLVMGDAMGHEFRSKYQNFSGDKSRAGFLSFARKELEFLTMQLSAAFPDMDVYMTMGNNDSYRGDYATNVNDIFFNDASRLWSSLIRDSANRMSMQKQFEYAGYYSLSLPNPGKVRLIVLNSVLFSYKAKGKNTDKYALEELDWLHAQLQSAKDHQQHVFIIMHIPEGVDIYATLRTRLFRVITLWKPQYIQRFQSELSMFAPEIVGIFSGHLHSDAYQIMTFGDGHEIPMIGVTSISPIFGNNPGFKLCSYQVHPFHLDDFVNYSYPIIGSKIWSQSRHAPGYA